MTISIPPLPEGWAGTPDELIEFIEENATFNAEGTVATANIPGQIGGSTPSEDIGIWFTNNSVEIFREGAYRPITDVPIGAGMPWFGGSTSVPPNFLFCSGSSLIRTDYPFLFAAIGTTWTPDSDSPTTFRLPNPAGRVPVGAGTGDYSLNQGAGITGEMLQHDVGEYFGKEWLYKVAKTPNGPTGTTVQSVSGSTIIDAANQRSAIEQPAFTVHWIIRYR